MLKLTPSRIREYQSCPRLFQEKYLNARGSRQPELTPALAFGSSIHAALDELHRPGRHPRQATTTEVLLRRNWRSSGYKDAAQEDHYFADGIAVLGSYRQTMPTPQGQILGTEVFMSRVATLDGHQFELGCKADRVELLLPDGALEVLDYKTNGDGEVPPVEMLMTDLPTFVYYVLARLCYLTYPHIVVSQLNVRSFQATVVDYTEEQRAANKQALADLVAEIETGAFEPRPNGHCAWCCVRAYCPLFGPETDLDGLI